MVDLSAFSLASALALLFAFAWLTKEIIYDEYIDNHSDSYNRCHHDYVCSLSNGSGFL